MTESETLQQPTPMPVRPAILETIQKEIDPNSRREELTKQKRQIETNLMEQLGNIRLQESLVNQKQVAYDALTDDVSDEIIEAMEKGLEGAKLILADRYQGGAALSEELLVINQALDEFEKAGVVDFNKNRAGRRAQRKK